MHGRIVTIPIIVTINFYLLISLFLLLLAKDAEQVNKNIKKQCWNVWYEAYLLTNDESSPNTGTSTPATTSLSSGMRRSSSNFDYAPIASAALNSSGLKKSRKVYCYITKKVCTLGLNSTTFINRIIKSFLAVSYTVELRLAHPSFVVL